MAGSALLKQGQARRREIMRFIKSFIRKNGFAPSLREISEGVGVSKTAVQHHLAILQDEGKIRLTPGHYRSLQVL